MNLTDMTISNIENILSDFPKFRAKQVYEWINKGCYIEEMKNIPENIKEKLKEIPFGGVDILDMNTPFETVIKHLNKLDDGNIVESVLMKYKHGNSLCISSQVGCNMGCKFCASTIDGVIRNLTAGEMFFLVARLNNFFATKEIRGITNIVIMGSGEPLANFDNIVKFIQYCKDRIGISPRNISLSTCGIVENIVKLADLNLGVNLCLSLHAPNDEIRQKIMPIANKYSIDQTINSMKYYFNKTKRRVIFEYVLIKDINDSLDNAKQLSKILKGISCHVNLIPYNNVIEREYNAPNQKTVDKFLNVLLENNISATKRRELGDDIDAACGQLRRKHINKI